MSAVDHSGDATEKVRKTKEVPCPDCYGGHFKPCNICGDSGVALIAVEQKAQSPACCPCGSPVRLETDGSIYFECGSWCWPVDRSDARSWSMSPLCSIRRLAQLSEKVDRLIESDEQRKRFAACMVEAQQLSIRLVAICRSLEERLGIPIGTSEVASLLPTEINKA